MISKLHCSILMLILTSLISLPRLHAKVEVEIPDNQYITTDGLQEIFDVFDEFTSLYGPKVADSFAIANIAGYPIASSYIGTFPSFFVGVSLNVGISYVEGKKTFYDKVGSDDLSPVPSANPVIYAGFGFLKGVDIMAKLMLFNQDIYKIPLEYDFLKITKFGIYSIGGKIRYNYVKKKTILPGMLSFGGVTLSAGFDMMKGTVQLAGEYEYDLDSIDVEVPDLTSGTLVTETIDYGLAADYMGNIGWTIGAVNVQALIYFQAFLILGVYTGAGLGVTYGSFDFKVEVDGQIETDSDLLTNNPYVPQELANVNSISAKAEDTFKPHTFVPLYIIGFELNLFLVRLTFESMVNMRNRRDINLQLGLRVQI